MASLTSYSWSPFWIARIRVWVAMPEHPQGGFWRKTNRSTKIPLKSSRKAAQRAADEMERIAQELRHSKPDRPFWEDRLAALMRAANVQPPVARTTWAKASKQWLAAKHVKDRSREKYASDLEHFRRFLGSRASHDLRDVTPDDFEEFYSGMLDSGLSANTSRNVVKTIRSVFERAHVLRFIESNPARIIRMKGSEESVRRPFTREDIAALLRYIEEHEDAEWIVAVRFGLYYGMRLLDATRRSFEEIEEQGGVRVIRFTPMKKSSTGRTITLPLVAELAGLRGTGLITPRLASLNNASKSFGRLLDNSPLTRKTTKGSKAGRSKTDKTFHSLRHTINSWMLDAGIDQRVRQLVCDHDDEQTSHRYTHASLKTMASAIIKATT